MSPAIVAHHLTKRYPDGTEAARAVSFQVEAGEIVGLLGANGAGKSTTLNMLATLTRPTSGEAFIFGVPICDRTAVRPLIGVALQSTGLDPLMSVIDQFQVQAALYRLSVREARVRTEELLDLFQLEGVYRRRTGELSGGTQRRLALALSLLHNPKAIIFDEPTVGLDPNLRRTVWKLLMELRSKGLAVLFSTHYMDEAESLCQRILLMSKGEIVASGTPDELRSRIATCVLHLRVRDESGRAEEAVSLAINYGIISPLARYSADNSMLEVHGDLGESSINGLISLFDRLGVVVVELHWGPGSLDEFFTQFAESTMDESQLQAVTMEHRALARRGGSR
ncbi:MAG: ABC transporter ATP-binding protein [Terracidiphilus sp.]